VDIGASFDSLIVDELDELDQVDELMRWKRWYEDKEIQKASLHQPSR
jgi:hypothetical protein